MRMRYDSTALQRAGARGGGDGLPRWFALALLVLAGIGSAGGTEFHIAVTGDDSGTGTKDRPFASLERARDAVRGLRRPLTEPVTVWIHAGDYVRSRELELFERDSGTESTPITYRAAEGETVRFIGGQKLRGWKPVTDPGVRMRLDRAAQPNVVQLDLRAAGITNFGELRSRGWGRPPATAAAELFVDGERMTLARWPNGEWSKIAGFPKESARGDSHGGDLGEIGGGFFYSGDRPRDWHDPTNVWIHGFWAWNWANSRERIEHIDYQRRLIKTAEPGGHFGFRPGQRIWFYNAIEELDAPGEWFIDRSAGLLYFWPAKPLDKSEAVISVLDRPLVTLREVSFVRFQSLCFEATRSYGFWIRNGRSNQLASCVIRDIGNFGVWVVDGQGHSVVGCDIYETGDGGVGLKGGDRNTLTPAGHRVENCHLHHNGVWTYTYVPAIQFDGVGMVASHNLIHDHTHTAILFEGNDHLIEFNEIHHVATDTGDSGAIYTGRDWSFRGNRIRNNYLHDVVGHENYGKGIYMDDCSSGIEISGNVFQRMKRAIQLGGGRDHRVENNQFIDCDTGIDCDGRGLDNAPIWRQVQKLMREQWNAMPAVTRELYLRRYPDLGPLLPYLAAEKPVPPENTVIARNVAFGRGKFIDIRWNAEKAPPKQARNVVIAQTSESAGSGRSGLRNPSKSAASRAGFRSIPVDEIGLRDDEARRQLPRLPAAQPVGTGQR